MARCQLVIGLCVIHLCFALSYGGFDYDPRLIPQAPSYYQPQPNPYANQYAYPYPQQGPYYPQPYPEQEPAYPTNFLEEEQDQTPSGSAVPATTGGAATATATNTASVQTPTDTSNAATSTGSTSTTSTMDALDIQLAAALEAVKTDMISKGKEVLEEKQWTDDVKSIIAQYTTKISNVYANIETLKTNMGDLYKKKQQIINAQIQKSLTQKLQDSKSDLQTVQAALDKVTNTQMEFEQSKKDIQSTIDSIFAQLNELKGLPASGATGSASGSASSSSMVTTSSSTDTTSSSTDTTSPTDTSASTDIVDQTAEINSKIDTIKSIVNALNSGSSPSTTP